MARSGGDLALHPVLSRRADGTPELAGAEALMTLSPLPEDCAGLVAVCKAQGNGVVVLGYVDAAAVAQAAQSRPQDDWLVIGTGKSRIRLHPDGRVRIEAQDVAVESSGRMALRGAWIDLN